MRFLALLKKELREAVPWLVLAAIVFGLIGSALLYERTVYQRGYLLHGLTPGTRVSEYELLRASRLADVGGWLLVVSQALALALGARQFWVPLLLKTWAFTIHRSVSRTRILLAKLAAAGIGFVGTVGVLWTLLFLLASRPGVLPFPPRGAILAEGWVFVLLGAVTYLGTALSALGKTRWYTTRMVPLAFAALVVFMVFAVYSGTAVAIILAVGLAALLGRLFHRFAVSDF